MAHVAREVIQPSGAARIASGFARRGDATEGHTRSAMRLVRCNPGLHHPPLGHVEMEAHFFLMLAIDQPRLQDGSQPCTECGNDSHAVSPDHARIQLTAVDVRSHVACSAASRRRPAAVRS